MTNILGWVYISVVCLILLIILGLYIYDHSNEDDTPLWATALVIFLVSSPSLYMSIRWLLRDHWL